MPRFFGKLTRGRVIEIDSHRPSGTVVDQSPKPGEMVRPGTSVDLVFSRSERTEPSGVPVPELRGMTEDQARSYIGQVRLRLGRVSYRTVEYGRVARVRPNIVIEQDPLPNRTVPVGTAINLVISRPPPPPPPPVIR
ncbi:MAG: PASTA domain-containing protein [Pyrinomonadaceae bacterium]|nr:PASTA domain-containing protein [Pyrinomonadaceae bacterium]